MTFDFDYRPKCASCRHAISVIILPKKEGQTDSWRITCAFKEEQVGHARVPEWCPKRGYLHDGKKEEK